ncbi:hypothetical protein [Filimonas effusa]|uniref:Uncharacterized protein n=1 Tax=Filimonas effusa TaxID=2508721 RepID=A0A4Q1D7M3_9BACT|nr:hypothetical protein [Filimonas effusa]RXK85287.1 hypothetical protein ESB13_00210 [Filimonas effusa]
MASEILLVQHNSNGFSKPSYERELQFINNVTSFVSTFAMFQQSYEIFDVGAHKKISRRKRCHDLYQASSLPAFHFAIPMN